MKKMFLKNIFLILFCFCFAVLSACSSRPTNVAYLPHLQNQQAEKKSENQTDRQAVQGIGQKNYAGQTDNSAQTKARIAPSRQTVFLEPRKPLNEYTGFIYQELIAPVSNALLENNFTVTSDREKADLIVLLDFGSEGIKKISKMICTPHYENVYYPDYSYYRSGFHSNYEYDYYYDLGGETIQTGTDCYPKEYNVYPHTLKVSAYERGENSEQPGTKLWEVELVYQSLHNEYRQNIKTLTSRLSRQLRDVTVWNNSVRIEFDNIR